MHLQGPLSIDLEYLLIEKVVPIRTLNKDGL